MKKLFFVLHVILVAGLLLSCNGGNSNKTGSMTKEDSAIIIAWKAVYKDATPEMLFTTFDKKIKDTNWVKTCIANYQKIYKNCADAGIKKAHTDTISYSAKELSTWLLTVLNGSDCDSIKITFGVYNGLPSSSTDPLTPDEIKRVKDGRLTIFLWPFSGNGRAKSSKKASGDLIDPFDLGEIHP